MGLLNILRKAPTSTMEMDLMNVDKDEEARVHKLKRLVQSPNSYFMDVRCKVTDEIITIFSHTQTVVTDSCGNAVAIPTGGKANSSLAAHGEERETESDFRRNFCCARLCCFLGSPDREWRIQGGCEDFYAQPHRMIQHGVNGRIMARLSTMPLAVETTRANGENETLRTRRDRFGPRQFTQICRLLHVFYSA